MHRRELDQELETYLTKRRKHEEKHGETKTEEVRMPPEIETYEEPKQKSWLAWLFGIGEEEEKQKEEKKEENFDEESVKKVMETEQLKSDLKEVSRIALAAFKDLPPDKLHTLKSSPDFEKFKEILRRHSIIK